MAQDEVAVYGGQLPMQFPITVAPVYLASTYGKRAIPVYLFICVVQSPRSGKRKTVVFSGVKVKGENCEIFQLE